MTKSELVKSLRAMTQAGMSDCISALNECASDLELAKVWLRERGMAKANKKAGAIAYEGIVRAGQKGQKAIIMEVNSQTDFTSQNENFLKLTDQIFNAIMDQAANCKTVEDVIVNGVNIKDAGMELTAKTGEKIAFRRARVVNATSEETLKVYTHANKKIATIILSKNNIADEVMNNIAMHVAAMAPKYLDETLVDQEWLASEKEILLNQFNEELNEIKDERVKAEKVKRADLIVEGKVKKLLKEICLVDQPLAMDSSITVGNYIAKHGGKLIKMIRYELGEGIQKKVDNFADEVAAQMSN